MNGIIEKATWWAQKQVARLYVWTYSKLIWYFDSIDQLKSMEESFDMLKHMYQLADEDPYYRFLYYKLYAINMAVLLMTYPENYEILKQKYDWLPEIES